MTVTAATPPRPLVAPRGLAGVVVTDTELGDVRGDEGFYHYRQYSAVDLAQHRSLEEVWHLLHRGHLPSAAETTAFSKQLAAARELPEGLEHVLPRLAAMVSRGGSLDGLRAGFTLVGSLRQLRPLWDLQPEERAADALATAAVVPTLLAALDRRTRGLPPVPPRDDLGHAANYLWMLSGEEPLPERARAIEQYLVATIDHGFNASTFTARVIASTGADMVSCLIGALGALSGPLHGGAPSRALDTLDAIGRPERTDSWVRERVRSGERIMGFGHPVYRTEDPRSRMLKSVAQGLGGELVDFAVQVEERVLATLAELKPDRQLHTNVEFYAGVVMEICGLPRHMFTPTFAVSRVIGWTANILEQSADTKIIRPAARYVGVQPPQPIPPRE